MGRFDKIKKNIKKKKRKIHALYVLILMGILTLGYIGGNAYQINKQNEIYQLNKTYASNIDKLNVIIDYQNDKIRNFYRIFQSIPLGPPTKTLTIVSGYGYRKDPLTDSLSFHSAIDIDTKFKEEIFATANGIVFRAEYVNGYGYCVEIKHSFNYSSLYAHLNNILVNKGDTIRKNDIIGLAGTTGRSTGVHLHYEVKKKYKPLNPEKFVELKY